MAKDNESLVAKLAAMEQRFDEIDKLIADPEINSNSSRLIPLRKEQGKLKNTVAKYRQYKKAVEGISEAQRMVEDAGSEAELKTMAEDEIKQLQGQRDSLLEEIKDSLVMGEDEAINSIIVEIRAGTGGDEAALFARDLYNMYVRYAESRKWKVEDLDYSTTERGGFREVIFGVKGHGVWADLCFEAGGHRVQRVPETEQQGRVHTSAATVAVLPEPEEVDVQINPSDVLEHVSRAGGPGGQNVNKVSSAIRLEHVPTGITVNMREDKSQHKNRAKAWRILRSRVFEHYQGQKRAEREKQRKTMIGSGDRSEKIRTYNFPQNRMTDHRINLSLYSLDAIMGGKLDEVVAALKEHEKEERLKNL